MVVLNQILYKGIVNRALWLL